MQTYINYVRFNYPIVIFLLNLACNFLSIYFFCIFVQFYKQGVFE